MDSVPPDDEVAPAMCPPPASQEVPLELELQGDVQNVTLFSLVGFCEVQLSVLEAKAREAYHLDAATGVTFTYFEEGTCVTPLGCPPPCT